MWLFLPVLVMLFATPVTPAVNLGVNFKNELTTPKVRIVVGSDAAARHKNLENLKTELSTLQQQWNQSPDFMTQKIAEIQEKIDNIKQGSSKKSSHTAMRKISLLQKLSAVLYEIQEVRAKILEILQQHIEFDSQQITENAQNGELIQEKSLYSFFDFQSMTKKMFGLEDQIRQLLHKKESIFTEISRQENILAGKEKELGSIDQSIESKKNQSDINKDEIALFDLEKEVIVKERELASLRLNFYHKQQEVIVSKEIVLQEKLRVLAEQVEMIRTRLYIDAAEIQQYERKNIEQKKQSEIKRSELVKMRQDTAAKKVEVQEELERLRHRFKSSIVNMQQFIELDQDIHTVSDRFALYSVTYGLNMVLVYDRMLQKIKTEMHLLDAQDRQMQIATQAALLLYDIVQGHSKDSESFEKERAEYKNLKQSLLGDIAQQSDAMQALNNLLKDAQKILDYLMYVQDTLVASNSSMSGTQHKKWSDCMMMLAQIIKDMQQHHELLLQTSDFSEQILRVDEETVELVTTILHEYDMIGVWHRSISAVTWEGIKNIIPNIQLFLYNMYVIITTYVAQITMKKIAYTFSTYSFAHILWICIIFFGLFLLYLFLQAILPSWYQSLLTSDDDEGDPLYHWRHLLAIGVGFCSQVFTPLFFWCLCFFYEMTYNAPVALLLFFYLYSIVFWIHASRRLMHVILVVNRQFDYFFLSKRLIDKFSMVFSFFAISTILILVLRKMFIVVLAHQVTELPNILLRLYHIVIFVSIIFSLDKDEIIQWLSKRLTSSSRLIDMLNQYYYLFLLGLFCLLVLCDPYLGGYGSLLWYVFWNLFLTVGICIAMFLLYNIAKQNVIRLFFEDTDSAGVHTERFDHAKTWYAIYVVSSMLLCLVVAIILCSHVWDYGFTYGTLRKVVFYELFNIESTSSAGKVVRESFKVLNLLYIIFVSCIGVMVAYLFKRFVLQKLFDIQYVDPGIQNTIIIISRYVIIIFFIMIACAQSKLGSLVTYSSYVGLVVFGWSFKDMFTDFVAYFFILVQRPVKLGDYVKIDHETMGVVRRVGPRAVILRRQNAVNIVVPNSTILKASLYNWNYTRSYIGFEEIVFSVPFGTDIYMVRKICLEVLDEDQDVLKVPQPVVRLQDFGDKGYVFMIRGFLSSGNTLRQWDIASNIRFALVDKLQKSGISIAGPSVKIFMQQQMSKSDLFD